MVNHREQPRNAAGSFISLGDLDPDLLKGLGESERADAVRVLLPVVDVSDRKEELAELIANSSLFGAIVLEGMLQHQMRIGKQTGLLLLAPGDVMSPGAGPSPIVVAASEWQASSGTRLALLGDEFLFAGRRWPEVFMNLHIRRAEQTERLVAQFAICQLPRVEDRLLAILWLLAESWGRVTPAGTILPLSLTHDALGALVGARRPTVSLALGHLADSGAVVHQDRGWLLVKSLTQGSGEAREIHAPEMLDDGPSVWTQRPPSSAVGADGDAGPELAAAFERLRAQHLRAAEQVQLQLRRIAAVNARARELCESVREQRAFRRLRSQRPPSA